MGHRDLPRDRLPLVEPLLTDVRPATSAVSAPRMRGFRHWRWHLGEMCVKLNGKMVYLGRGVDQDGEVLESYTTKTRDKAAALAFLMKVLMGTVR